MNFWMLPLKIAFPLFTIALIAVLTFQQLEYHMLCKYGRIKSDEIYRKLEIILEISKIGLTASSLIALYSYIYYL